jgi:hypothetical protein
MKKSAKITAPSRNPTTFAPRTDRIRKMLNGIRGARPRNSISTKAARMTPEAISSRIVRAEPQPTSGAFEIA